MIKIKNLNKTYKSRKTTHHALKDVNLDFSNTGLNFILGKSGCGKTTLMNMIGGLDKFDSGDIIIKHLSLAKASNTAKDRLRNTVIGFIFQDFNLIEHMTVIENVVVSLKLQGVHKSHEELQLAKKAIAEVGLDKLGDRKINELSGGQKQRVAIARALIKNPDILLCDEPTGNLDDDTSNNIFELLKEISRTKLVIVVSHNDKLAYHYGDRVINILDGVVIKDELTAKKEDITTKSLEYKGNYDSKSVAKEVLSSIENNLVINAKIINDDESNNGSNDSSVLKQKEYNTKDVSMFRVLFKTAFGYFTLRKIRLVILTILMCFSLSIGAYMIGIYTYNGKSDTVHYLEENDSALNKLYCDRRDWRLDCDDELFVDFLLDSKLGEDAIAYSGNSILDSSLNFEIPGMTYSSYDYLSETSEIAKVLVSPNADLAKYFELTSNSSKIVSDNDIYITDRIAYHLDPSLNPEDFIGKQVSSVDDTFTIKGVILTDFADIDFNSLSWYEQDGIQYKYNIVLYNKDYVDNKLDSFGLFDGSDFTMMLDDKSYIYTEYNDFAKESLHIDVDTTLIAGKKPTGYNEIVVSREYMCGVLTNNANDYSCYNGASESTIISRFEQNLGTEIGYKYASYYETADIAYLKTFRNDFKIVGVMEDITTNGNTIGYLLSDEAIDAYNDNLTESGSKFVLLSEDDYKYFTNYIYDASNNDKIIGEDYIVEFDSWDAGTFSEIGDLSNYKGFVIFVVATTLVFTLVSTVISNFNLNFIVENKKKEIGIFKAQGYRNRQLNMIFIIIVLLQTLLITVISATLTTLFMNMVNSIAVNGGDMQYSGYEFITFGIEEFLYLFTCTFIFGVLSLFKPLRKMAKTDPIDVIKNL